METAPATTTRHATESTASNTTAHDGWRETVELLAVSLALALLLRQFVAPSFVIPTGSMAPVLLGRHHDLVCPQCGQEYALNAAYESLPPARGRAPTSIDAGTCPNCRYVQSIPREAPPTRKSAFRGDRILATPLDGVLAPLRRWDVTVFRSPETAQEFFIKRLVGLPGERVTIRHGDVLVAPADGASEPVVARKPPDKLLAMAQPVHDNDRLPAANAPDERWSRWRASGDLSNAAGAPSWQPRNDGRAFELSAATSEPAWLRYHHLPLSEREWRAILTRNAAPPVENEATNSDSHAADNLPTPPRPQLITDFSAYNTYRVDGQPRASEHGLHWVGDLIVECELQADAAQGELLLELIEAGRRHRCAINLATGETALSISTLPDFAPRARLALAPRRVIRLRLANADDQLLLWLDDQLVSFDGPTTYAPTDDELPTRDDLAPVGVALHGVSGRLSHLRVLRDVYTIATRRAQPPLADYDPPSPAAPSRLRQGELANFFADPDRWGPLADRGQISFTLGPDDFLLLGDNSPESRDARLWGEQALVRRNLLVGKALCVYWPHPWPTDWSLPLLGGERRFPCYPSFSRMRLIR